MLFGLMIKKISGWEPEDGGINIYNPRTKTYSYLTADKGQKNSLSKNCIKAFLDDGKGNLWVGTYMGGIDVVDLQTGKILITNIILTLKIVLSDNRVWDLCLIATVRCGLLLRAESTV